MEIKKPKSPLTKKSKKKKKLHPRRKREDFTIRKSILPAIPDITATDQSAHFVSVLENLYATAISGSYAASVLELKILHQLVEVEGEEGEEVEDRFDKAKFLLLQDKLLELKALKDLGSAFGLDGETVRCLIETRIQALFGKTSSKKQKGTAFVGDDSQFLTHMIKQRILQKQNK